MDGNPLPIQKGWRAAALIAAAMVFASPSGSPVLAGENGADTFAAAFAPFEALPAFPLPPAGAVDIDSIEPPIEGPLIERELGSGIASYYGRKFQGRRTANGESFDMHALTAAHRTLPFGSLVMVTNPANGRSVTVRINDRGPFVSGRMIDLSRAAARQIGIVQQGHGTVELALLD